MWTHNPAADELIWLSWVAPFFTIRTLRKLICWHFGLIAKSIGKSNRLLNAHRQKGSKLYKASTQRHTMQKEKALKRISAVVPNARQRESERTNNNKKIERNIVQNRLYIKTDYIECVIYGELTPQNCAQPIDLHSIKCILIFGFVDGVRHRRRGRNMCESESSIKCTTANATAAAVVVVVVVEALFSCSKLLNPSKANSLYLLWREREKEWEWTEKNIQRKKFSIKHISSWHLFNLRHCLWACVCVCDAANHSIQSNSEYANKSLTPSNRIYVYFMQRIKSADYLSHSLLVTLFLALFYSFCHHLQHFMRTVRSLNRFKQWCSNIIMTTTMIRYGMQRTVTAISRANALH